MIIFLRVLVDMHRCSFHTLSTLAHRCPHSVHACSHVTKRKECAYICGYAQFSSVIFIYTPSLFHPRSYVECLAVEANDMLQEAGYLSISELCNTFDLPFDFLLEVREELCISTSVLLTCTVLLCPLIAYVVPILYTPQETRTNGGYSD